MKRASGSTLSGVLALILLAVLSISVLLTLLGGTRVYQNLTRQGQEDYNRRTCLQYLSTKLRQAQTPDSLELKPFGDGDALFLLERYGSRTFVTRIYCHDGWLMELFSIADESFSPEDGERILPLDGLRIQEKPGVVEIEALYQGQAWRICHATEGGNP